MPTNVRNFFWLNIATLALGLASAVLMAPATTALATTAGQGPAFVLTIQVFVAVIMLLLFWLIAYRRQNWARWILAVLFVLGLPGYFLVLKNFMGMTISGAISLVQFALQAVALYLVFTGNAKPWFRKDPVQPG